MTVYDDNFNEVVPTPTTKSGLPSVYDQLRETLSKPANTAKEITLKVPARDGVAVKFHTNIPLEKLDRWRVAAKKKNKKDEIDVLFFNQIIIASQCVGLIFNGKEVFDESSKPLTFRHAEIIDSLNALDAYGAIQVLYDRDADILKAGSDIITAAGYNDDDETDDTDETDPLDLV